MMKIEDLKTKSSRIRYKSERRRKEVTGKRQVAYFTLLYAYKYSSTPRYRSRVSRVVTDGSLKRKPTKMDCRKSIRHVKSSTVSVKLTVFIYFFFFYFLLTHADTIRFGVLKKFFPYCIYILRTEICYLL